MASFRRTVLLTSGLLLAHAICAAAQTTLLTANLNGSIGNIGVSATASPRTVTSNGMTATRTDVSGGSRCASI